MPSNNRLSDLFSLQLVINFADDAGHIIDTYLTTVSSPKLDTQTSQGQAGQSSAVKVQVINENLIVLTHAASESDSFSVIQVDLMTMLRQEMRPRGGELNAVLKLAK